MQNLPAGFQNLQVLPQNFDMQNLAMKELQFDIRDIR